MCVLRWESEEQGHTTYGSGHDMVQNGVRWSRELQSAETNVVNNMHSNEPWHAEGHARELAIQFRDDLAHCLGGARGRRE